MTETILAIAILFSLIVLGGLISIGNERQRKAIDKISEHAQAWAIEDLRLKRGQVEGSVSIEDPVAWLSTAASRALGMQIQLTLVEVLENPTALSCIDETSGDAIFFSLSSPKELRSLFREKRSELSKRGAQHPLAQRKKGIDAFEMNILNAGVRFDIDLIPSWQKMSGNFTTSHYLWVYQH
ncbi:MAG: hypothetical protein HN855_09540 [Anaerolineae bacterium]|jgi:hypothetical protein|nr:hypothetical protein [Anaerolineae bacterium]MBT7325390.1 hypothetical protein [Anaerolineae bacterium]